MNLALPTGTGIATYGRNFIEAARQLGHEVDFLIGGIRLDRLGSRPATDWLAAAAPTSSRLPFGPVHRLIGALRTVTMPQVKPLEVVGESRTRVFHVDELFANAVAGFHRFGRMTELRVPGIDMAHWTAPVPIRIEGAINVYTIHDLVPLTHPELVLGSTDRFRRLCQAIAHSADHILTVSESSRRDIIAELGVSPKLVSNTYQTIEASFWQPPAAVRAEPARDTLSRLPDRGYFLFFGAVEPKKNLARILAAHDDRRITLPLVVVGTPGWGCPDVVDRLNTAANDPDQRIVVVPPVDRQRLAGLIRAARATVFPSVYEGFGLPALESLVLDTPVIGSTTGSLPEVIGPGGLLVDPLSVTAIRAAMLTLQENPQLGRQCASAGKAFVARFTPYAYRDRLGPLLDSLMVR